MTRLDPARDGPSAGAGAGGGDAGRGAYSAADSLPPGPTLAAILLYAALCAPGASLTPHLRAVDSAALGAAFRGWTLALPSDAERGFDWRDATLVRAEGRGVESPARNEAAPLWSAASGWRRGVGEALSAVAGPSLARTPTLRVRSTAQSLPPAPLVDAGTEEVLARAWTDPAAGTGVAQQFWRQHYEAQRGAAQRASIRTRARQQLEFHARYRERIARATRQSQAEGHVIPAAAAAATAADAAMRPVGAATAAIGQSSAVTAAVREAMADMMGASQGASQGGEAGSQAPPATGIDLFSQSTLGPASQESAGMFSTQTVDFFSQ